MAAVRHIGNLKKRHDSETIRYVSTKIGKLMDMKSWNFFSRRMSFKKSKMADGRHIGKKHR